MSVAGDTIILTDADHARLVEMVEVMRTRFIQERGDAGLGPVIAALEKELGRALVVNSEETPPDVVTIGSRVQVADLDSGDLLEFTVVWPDEADPDGQKVSLLAPVGMALLGCRAGQVVEWPVPAGRRRLRISKILYRPEAGGNPIV